VQLCVWGAWVPAGYLWCTRAEGGDVPWALLHPELGPAGAAAVDADKAFAIQVSHEESVLANQSTTYMQTALLYTTSGERRIRVYTVAVPVVRDITELFRRADSEAIATVLAKISAFFLPPAPCGSALGSVRSSCPLPPARSD